MEANLLVIDCQKDFCTTAQPELAQKLLKANGDVYNPYISFVENGGALCVPGAEEDCKRTAAMISRLSENINQIHVTLDSHNDFDIAHPVFWIDENDCHPPMFTIISLEDITFGKWAPSSGDKGDLLRAVDYATKLQLGGKYPLCIWPPHCIVGTEGHAIQEDVSRAIRDWGVEEGKSIRYIHKGLNPWTEHYSAVKADVPDLKDPNTLVDEAWIKELKSLPLIILGQALSHCVASTVDHLLELLDPSQMILITDCCSNVPTFESNGDNFVARFRGAGGDPLLSENIEL